MDSAHEPIGLIRYAASIAEASDVGSGCGIPMPIEWRQRELAKVLLTFALNCQGRPKLKSQLKAAVRGFYKLAETDGLFPGASESTQRQFK